MRSSCARARLMMYAWPQTLQKPRSDTASATWFSTSFSISSSAGPAPPAAGASAAAAAIAAGTSARMPSERPRFCAAASTKLPRLQTRYMLRSASMNLSRQRSLTASSAGGSSCAPHMAVEFTKFVATMSGLGRKQKWPPVSTAISSSTLTSELQPKPQVLMVGMNPSAARRQSRRLATQPPTFGGSTFGQPSVSRSTLQRASAPCARQCGSSISQALTTASQRFVEPSARSTMRLPCIAARFGALISFMADTTAALDEKLTAPACCVCVMTEAAAAAAVETSCRRSWPVPSYLPGEVCTCAGSDMLPLVSITKTLKVGRAAPPSCAAAAAGSASTAAPPPPPPPPPPLAGSSWSAILVDYGNLEDWKAKDGRMKSQTQKQ